MISEKLTRHRVEREQVRGRIYGLEQELEQLKRREIELGGIIATLQHLQEQPESANADPANV